jgi:hypothetical protein
MIDQSRTMDLPSTPQLGLSSLPAAIEVFPRWGFFAHTSPILLLLAAAFAAVYLGLYEPEASLQALSVACGLASIGVILHARYILGFAWLSASVLALLQMWCYQFGLVFTAAIMPAVLNDFPSRQIRWLYFEETRLAILLSILAMGGLALGMALVAGKPAATVPRDTSWPESRLLRQVGWGIMALGLAGCTWVLMRAGGPGVFRMTYIQFATEVNPALLPMIQISQFGCLLAIVGSPGRTWVQPLAVWAAFGVAFLLLGLRNEALVPLTGFVAVLTRRGVRFQKLVVWIVLGTILFLVPAIRVFRTVGFANRQSVNWTQVTPLETFVELGGTLRASRAYITWIKDGDELLYGATYWAPFDRHFLRFLAGGRRIAPEQDPRIPGARMVEREGAVGTSTVGEAYYNFGVPGPVIYFTAIGLLLGWLDRRAAGSHFGLASMGWIIMVIYWSIRGQFLAVPAQITAGLLLILMCKLLSRCNSSAPAYPVSN